MHPKHVERYNNDPEYAAWVRSVKMQQRFVMSRVRMLDKINNLRLVFGLLALAAFAAFWIWGSGG